MKDQLKIVLEKRKHIKDWEETCLNIIYSMDDRIVRKHVKLCVAEHAASPNQMPKLIEIQSAGRLTEWDKNECG